MNLQIQKKKLNGPPLENALMDQGHEMTEATLEKNVTRLFLLTCTSAYVDINKITVQIFPHPW